MVSESGSATFRYGGSVVNAQGQPVSGAEVTATYHRDTRSFSYIDVVTADANGHFRIDRAQAISGRYAADIKNGTIRLQFRHPDYAYVALDDVRQLAPAQATRLTVTLPEGRSVTGQVVDAGGQPVAHALVEITFGDDREQRRGTTTDAQGRYRFGGLPDEAGVIKVLTIAQDAPLVTAKGQVTAGQSEIDTLVATAITLPEGTVVHELFGMKLCDVDASLQAAFHLSEAGGVLVLEPGSRGTDLELQRGDQFFLVGSARVRNFADFAKQLFTLRQAPGTQQKPGAVIGDRVRLVWNFRRPDFAGTNTQYLTLDTADVAALEALQLRIGRRR